MDWSKALVITTVSAMLISAVKDILDKKSKLERLEEKVKDLEKENEELKKDKE